MRHAPRARALLLLLAAVSVGITCLPILVRAADPPVAMAAPMAWPDSVTQLVMRVRATIQTTDMAGYRNAVSSPNGALLLDAVGGVRDRRHLRACAQEVVSDQLLRSGARPGAAGFGGAAPVPA